MRIRAFIAALIVGLLFATSPCSAWKFASLADSRGDTNGVNTPVLTSIVNLINLENVDLVIFQGDAVSGCDDTCLSSQMDTWLSIVNQLNCPWYFTPGNHEISGSGSEAVLRGKVDQPLNGPSGHEEMVYSFDFQSAHFVALNSDHYAEWHLVQRPWLTTDLAGTSQPHIFVMAHDPAYPAGPHSGSSLDAYPAERDAFWNTLTNNNVKMYFCGHEHLYARSLNGSVYQVINGTCGAPLSTPPPGTIAKYHYVVADVNGYNVSCQAKDDTGAQIDSWSYVLSSAVPIVTSPAGGSIVATTAPTVQWDSPSHDMYQVRITQLNDPNVAVNGWDSGQVAGSGNSAVSGALNDFNLYHVFVRVHTGSGWGPWSPKGHNFTVNSNPSFVHIYPGDSLPTQEGWQLFDTGSYQSGNGITSVIQMDGRSNGWKLTDASASNRCKEKWAVPSLSFDTGATIGGRIRTTSASADASYNLGISKTGVGGMYIRVRTDQVALVDRNGNIMGTYALDGTAYHVYRLTVQNSTPGNNSTALWKVYVDATEQISWTGAGTDSGFDGFMAGHANAIGSGTWYFDWIAARADGQFTLSQWDPVDPDDWVPPGPMTNLAAVPGDAQNSLTWTNPTDADFAGTKILFKTTDYPSGPYDATATTIYDDVGTYFTHSGLTNGVTYYYSAFAHDFVPNYSTRSTASATPVYVPPPGPVTSFKTYGGSGRIDLAWTNPTDPSLVGVKILYKASGGYPLSPTDPSATVIYSALGTSYSHTGLTNGTKYYYAAYAYTSSTSFSTVAQSSTYAAAEVTIPTMKGLANSVVRSVKGNVVTAVFTGYFYMQDRLNPYGLKVSTTETPLPSIGQKVDVLGYMTGMAGNERALNCTNNSIRVTDPGPIAIVPAALNNKAVGGANLNSNTPGVVGGTGTNNVGLLVRVCGKVTQVQAGQYFYVDDGCGLKDGTKTSTIDNVGIRIKTSPPGGLQTGNYVVVTGIVSPFSSSGLRPQILPIIGGVQTLKAP